MKTVKEIRQQFLDFFASKGHEIVASAPIVNQNDPTLMFINSGMAQFKDYFLGNKPSPFPRVADTQKCLRVSGKHNDLEDVGMDGTHHTMFEMLGNWSFGDYFKKEAIQWSWELLTEVYGIPKDRLYATVFEGDSKENLGFDQEAYDIWLNYLPKDHIVYGNKKDNFWEMGDTGPCGPCSEIHVDMRSDEDRKKLPGEELVNKDHPMVIEIWNNVFMQFERTWNDAKGGAAAMVDWERNFNGTKDSSEFKKARNEKHTELSILKELSAKHVDTGMGLERLCMVIQGVYYTYDTDAFSPIIRFLEQESGIKYTGNYEKDAKTDIAMRVIADHIRAVTLVIGDGQLPSSTGAGYVVRRVLRRAVRYYFSFLGIKEPLMYRLLPIVADMFDNVFPEVKAQENFIAQVIKSEEESFLRTLANGLKRLDEVASPGKTLDGRVAFELYDTFGFPIDLTMLIGKEKGFNVDERAFDMALSEQKDRSKRDAEKETGNWTEVASGQTLGFVGYDQLENTTRLLRYRKVVEKKSTFYHLVLEQTPFYPEGGGQVGDTGTLWFGQEKIDIIDTRKENDLIISISTKLPANPDSSVKAVVDAQKRQLTENNHSATHLLHAALRQVLGTHVQQKGSLVSEELLRFDFSHFQKMTEEEIEAVEKIVNKKIREGISLKEQRALPIEEAKQSGAMMLFGEKYGDTVRVITFDDGYSKELCGGCHVKNTGHIGLFKIKEETSIAAGVRRVVAVTADVAEELMRAESQELAEVRARFNNPKDLLKTLDSLLEEQKKLQKTIEELMLKQAQGEKDNLIKNAEQLGDILFIGAIIGVSDKDATKQLCAEITQLHPNALVVLGASEGPDKAVLTIHMNRELSESKGINAGQMIREAAKAINGGGGGQPFFATAGGKDPKGLEVAIGVVKGMIG
jgi:alanyl-tRNA synthetase